MDWRQKLNEDVYFDVSKYSEEDKKQLEKEYTVKKSIKEDISSYLDLIKYRHFQDIVKGKKAAVTIAHFFDKDRFVHIIGFAFCGHKDKFCKARGRQIAFGRLTCEQFRAYKFLNRPVSMKLMPIYAYQYAQNPNVETTIYTMEEVLLNTLYLFNLGPEWFVKGMRQSIIKKLKAEREKDDLREF